jgi:Uma2 family endonuclease
MKLPAQRMSVADYLAMEERSQIRHEYVDGEVFAMSGASLPHNLLVSNLHGHAWQARASHGCRIFASAMKVRVEARNSFYYPDVLGCCDLQDGLEGYLLRPCFVIEVLSPSTAAIDQREKRLAYLTMKSLDEYVIVDQSRMQVAVYHGGQGPWASEVLRAPEDVLKLSCVSVGIALRDIYEGVELPKFEVRDDVEVPEYVTSA